MPEALWAEAVELAEVHGVSCVCRELGLGYPALRSRIPRVSMDLQGGTEALGGGFVELGQWAGCGHIRMEVSKPNGYKLFVEASDIYGASHMLQMFLGKSS